MDRNNDGRLSATPAAFTRPIAEAIGVSKRFGASQALNNVSLSLAPGDTRALVGRNGAGKSTLVSVLTGLISPDAGHVRLADEEAPNLSERRKWRERVACVYQKSTVIPTLTVAENLLLNAHPTNGGWISWSALRRKARTVLEEWGLEVDVDLDAARLSVEQRQIVEIARALLQGTHFIILDEPTAQLEAREVTRLFDRIIRLQESGITFLYISHYLEEIYEICRGVTVLRDGKVVADSPLDSMPKEQVVAAMVGDGGRATVEKHCRRNAGDLAVGQILLDVNGLYVGDTVDGVSFQVTEGECVGLTGLKSSGKEEIGDVIAGLLKPTGGTIHIKASALGSGRVIDAQRSGVSYVPRDRHARGIVPHLALSENLTMTIMERLGPWGLVLPKERDQQARRMVSSLGIVTSSLEQPISHLSGGNQQKAMVGRALASQPEMLIVNYPTQGVDIASKEAIFAILESARRGGAAVLVVTDDLDELNICDRVLVVFKGRLIAELDSTWRDEDLVAAIAGVTTGG